MKQAIFLLSFLILLSTLSLAQSSPEEVKVGIYVLNVGKFDLSSGSYTVDFYLSMECDNPCNPEGFEFMNGRASTIDKIIDEPSQKFYRIQAGLSENIDLKDYPFDRHYLPISIEDKRKTIEEQVYVLDEKNTGIDPSVTLVGWELEGWNGEVENHYYKTYGETFSRLNFKIGIKRIYLTSILKTFLPIAFIVLVGLLALLIAERDKLWTRIGINTSSLIASVMFHLNITSSIPPVGYLTFADKFMIFTYIILTLNLLSTIQMMIHAKKGDENLERRIYKLSLIGIPALAIIGYAIIFLIR